MRTSAGPASEPVDHAAAAATDDATDDAAPPTRLYLVRHGATQLTAEHRFSGAAGALLSAEGRRQAAALGDRLRREEITVVYSSPAPRALDTACLATGVPAGAIEQCAALREIGHGRWEGLTRREVGERFPAEYAAWRADPFTSAPDGGESGAEVLARALPAIRGIVTRHPGARVLVVSHRAAIRLVISGLLGFDARGYRDRLDQAPGCLNVIDFHGPSRARLMLFNDTSHYATHSPPGPQRPSARWD